MATRKKTKAKKIKKSPARKGKKSLTRAVKKKARAAKKAVKKAKAKAQVKKTVRKAPRKVAKPVQKKKPVPKAKSAPKKAVKKPAPKAKPQPKILEGVVLFLTWDNNVDDIAAARRTFEKGRTFYADATGKPKTKMETFDTKANRMVICKRMNAWDRIKEAVL